MRGLSEHQFLIFLVQFTLLLGLARFLGGLARRLRQPSVIGEVLAGVLLGPAVFGQLLPHLHAFVFPAEPEQGGLLELLSWIGMILLMLRTGIDTDLGLWRSLKKAALLASLCGIVVPFAVGLGVGQLVPGDLVGSGGRALFSLFLATAMSISAVKVIAKILLDLNLTRRNVGFVILGASVLDDTVGWVILAIVVRVAQSGELGLRAVAGTLAATAGFAAGALWLLRPLAGRGIRYLEREGRLEYGTTSAVLVLTLACGAITQALGIHAIFGAFVAGLIVGESPRIKENTLESIDSMVIGVFAPVFFAYSGLKVQAMALPGWKVTALVIGGAVVGKVAGAAAGARLGGMRGRSAAAVGVGLSARGSMELVVARIGMDLGVLAAPMYSLIVAIPILTSLATPLLLRAVLRSMPTRGEEARRLEDEARDERAIIKRRGTKILVPTTGEPHSLQALRLAAPLARLPGATLVGLSVVTPRRDKGPPGKTGQQVAEEAVRVARDFGIADFHASIASAATAEEAITAEVERGYDLVFVGLDSHWGLSHRVVKRLLASGSAVVVLLRSHDEVERFRRILLPVTGSAHSRAAVELAFLYAKETRAKVTLLHVVELSSVLDRRARDEMWLLGGRMLDELLQRGRHAGIEVRCRLMTSRFPAGTILDVQEKERADLLLLGAMPRYVEQRAFFGPTVDLVLEHATCPVGLYVGGVRPAALRAASPEPEIEGIEREPGEEEHPPPLQ